MTTYSVIEGPEPAWVIDCEVIPLVVTEDHCWLWPGAVSGGYPVHRGMLLHRLPRCGHDPDPSWTVDHVCHNWALARGACLGGSRCLHRRCLNPEHLEWVPGGVNSERMHAARRLQGVPTYG